MDIEANIREFICGKGASKGIQPLERYASFDYCFNHFQSFREAGTVREMANPAHMQQSCLQLGYFLASWGMLRGSAQLHQKSAKALESVIQAITAAGDELWAIDADRYTPRNIRLLLDFRNTISDSLRGSGGASDILATKIMLGVFGNVPAFDTYFKQGFGVATFGQRALQRIGAFYQEYAPIIDRYLLPTLDFNTGLPTTRHYTKAKVIDMIFFIEGGKESRTALISPKDLP